MDDVRSYQTHQWLDDNGLPCLRLNISTSDNYISLAVTFNLKTRMLKWYFEKTLIMSWLDMEFPILFLKDSW